MKKKTLAVLLALTMVAGLTACGAGESTETPATESEESTESNGGEAAAVEEESTGGEEAKPYKAALLLNGTLGDKSFYDSANEGLTKLRDELGADVFDFKVEQMGGTAADQAKHEPTVMDYCESGEWDVLIMGTWQMTDPLKHAAEAYPDQKFIFFDEVFDFEGNGNPDNIYNVLYKQNEVSFLVGAAAAMMTTDGSIEGIDPTTKKIGFLGGQENATISDFLAGFKQGVAEIDPEIEIDISWVGDFIDSTKGKDLALAQFQNGCDVGYNVAGNAGLGQIEAAHELGLYAFGVDSDQAALLPEYASSIPSSALKNVGNSLIRAIKMDMEGTLPYGSAETLGFSEGGVGLAKGENYEAVLPENIRTKLDELEQKIISGEIVVETGR